MKQRNWSYCVIGVLLIVTLGHVYADIPRIISYQGRVTDGGTPVADGTYNMRFRIYDAATGGSILWNSGLQSVNIAGGVFNVLLGENPQPELDLPFDQDYWLLVTFSGINQTPRQKLASTSYAYMASGLVPGTEIVGEPPSGLWTGLTVVNTSQIAGGVHGIYAESRSTTGIGISGGVTATIGETVGVYGSSESNSGRGVLGYTTYGYAGVLGQTVANAGYGVRGENLATFGSAVGVFGSSQSSAGFGVRGENNATSGDAVGVYGISESPWGIGVYGSTSGSAGIWGINESSGGYGVVGEHRATAGAACGVLGSSDSVNGTGVEGIGAVGVDGRSYATAGIGVLGVSLVETGVSHGIMGSASSESGTGVLGTASHTTGWTIGVHGQGLSTVGSAIYGHAAATSGSAVGVRGKTESNGNGVGVYGIATATTGSSNGVWGQTASPGGYGVYYTGGLAGTGTKSCVVKTSQGPTLLYCQESPENWFEDFGEGQLSNGICHIELDPLFLETVTIDDNNPIKVFIEHRGPCNGTYILTGETGFTVIEQNEGKNDTPFCYRIVAKRKGFEHKRLDYCQAAEKDSFLFPEMLTEDNREGGSR